MNRNLEALIEDHAKVMAEQMVKSVEWVGSEEDIRHEVNKLIDEFIKKAGLRVKGRHEYGLAGGRIDSKYGGVVIEYKDPKGAGKITENKNATGVKAVVQQIQKRFHDLQAEEHVGMERIFGVGCDGNTFVFVRMRGAVIDVEDPQPVTPHTVQRLLRAIVSLGAHGLSFTPENLAAHFGSESESAQDGVRLIYDLIHETDSPKAQTFFRQWQILFGEVCGYDIHGQSDKVKRLADHYHVLDPNAAELLFAVHTYYAIFMKMLAAEIVSSFSPLGTSTLKKLIAAATSAKLRDELHSLELGSIWAQLGIRNFLEGDLFAWYLDAWNEGGANAVRAMIRSLDQFDPTTLSVDPAESRDLLKHLYQQLFPRSVRHDLGEYYTPDWLAELTLNRIGYDGNPDKRLLDPACGSGTFLVMALNRVKTWYDEHRHECGFGEDEVLHKVLQNIIGFDLNPLAVMAARTNYLMAIRDLLRHASNVELPVYLCDSIMTPSQYGDLFTGDLENVRQLKTSAGDFNIPTEVANNRDHIGRYADTLETCIRDGYSPEEFVERCETEGIPATEAELHKKFYRHLQRLNADNQNGIWARIIKNAFAPLFIEKVDYVAGNPPWVNWESLPEGYREGSLTLWDYYDLRPEKGQLARMKGGKKDLSMLFVYVAADKYLRTEGMLGYVITQSVFKSGSAASGFRRFQLPDNHYIRVAGVDDMSALSPFVGATNRTAILACSRSCAPTEYPVAYNVWTSNVSHAIEQYGSYQEVIDSTTVESLAAQPSMKSSSSSPWLTARPAVLSGISKIAGVTHYTAREGVNTGGLSGCYWIRILSVEPGPRLLIANLSDAGRKVLPEIQMSVESDLVYPLVRGRDVRRWHAQPAAYILAPQDEEKHREGISEARMRKEFPNTYSFLRHFEEALSARPDRKYYPAGSPFYTMRNVAPYTRSEWKVVFKDLSEVFQCAVLGPGQVASIPKPVFPDLTLRLIPTSSAEEAHYVAALLNSSPSLVVLHSSSVGVQTQRYHPGDLKKVGVPPYDREDRTHGRLAKLSRTCHSGTAQGEAGRVADAESEIDSIAASIWSITDSELRAIQKTLADM
jgi:hypothetical protein